MVDRIDKTQYDDPKLWYGLNKATGDSDKSDIVVFGVPHAGMNSPSKSCETLPQKLRKVSKILTPFTEAFSGFESLTVRDAGDFSRAGKTWTYEKENFIKVRDFVAELTRKGQRFCMLGGDHASSIPVMQGIDKACEGSIGIIYIGARFDLCDSIDGDEYATACASRRALELINLPTTESIYFIGTRSAKSEEFEFMKEKPIKVVSSSVYHRLETDRIAAAVIRHMKQFDNIYLSIDIDCLDPGCAPSVPRPEMGGMTSRQLLVFLSELFKELDIRWFDVVGALADTSDDLTLYTTSKIICECFGHIANKLGKLEISEDIWLI